MLLPIAAVATVAADELLKIMLLLPLPLIVPPASSSTGIYLKEKCKHITNRLNDQCFSWHHYWLVCWLAITLKKGI